MVFMTRMSRLTAPLYDVTDTVDQAVMIPVAKGYDVVVPNALQQGVLNVFQNLRGVGSGINGFLQGKPKAGLTDLTRVVINSTFGVGGLFDLASRAGLQNQDEDFGQTLAVWGGEAITLYLLSVFGSFHDSRSTLGPFSRCGAWPDIRPLIPLERYRSGMLSVVVQIC